MNFILARWRSSLGVHDADTHPNFATVPRTLAISPFGETVLFESSPDFLHKKQSPPFWVNFVFGALEKIRTPDLLVRSQTLYPAELPAQNILKCLLGFKPP